ncbi:MAG: NADH-quinone oxidoreductase subunit M [Oligoflexia bacterium]|nr:NADH-quinone oxidoreductase subunit M [Oligoflexia bacterium]
MSQHLITLMILLPFVGAILQAFVPNPPGAGRWIALAASVLASVCGVALVASLQGQTADLQAIESLPWIGSFAISYEMGIDGLNALLVLLVAIIFPVLVGYEWNQKLGRRGVHGLFLLLQCALFGTVCAQDLFLQFFFWAFTSIPVYFLVAIWGGEERENAAFRSLVAASIGNALLFAALILIYYSVEPHTFALKELAGGRFSARAFHLFGSEFPVSGVAFALIGAGLALRIPVWPVHGWFTQIAEEAPPSVLVAFAGATVPVAIYVFIRLTYALFPEILSSASGTIMAVGAMNLVIGGICAVAQRSLRPLLAFVCLGQVGFMLLGIGSLSSAGLVGAVYQQFVVGLGLAGFALLLGIVIDRVGHADFMSGGGNKGERSFGGVAVRAPTVAIVAGIFIASLLGFPGSGGFVGNALVMIGSYSALPGLVLLAGAAVLLAAYYLFTMYRHVFLGKPRAEGAEFKDLSLRERALILPLAASLLAFGIYPKPLLELVRPTVLTLLSTVK